MTAGSVRPGRAALAAGAAMVVVAALAWATAPRVRHALAGAGAGVAQRPLAGGTAGAPAPRAARVRVVILDGLARADADAWLPGLAAVPGARALTVDVGFPTKSLVVQHVLWTGLTAQQSGIAARNERLDPPAAGTPSRVPGAIAVVESHRAIADSFGFAVVRPEPAADRVDPDASAAQVAAWRDGGFEAALREAAASDAPLVLIHVLRIDAAAHASGRGAAYRAAIAWADRVLAPVIAGDRDGTWLILSDHGHVPSGGHGDAEDEVRRVRAWLRGPIAPGGEREPDIDTVIEAAIEARGAVDPEVHLVDLARWLAETCGVDRDGRDGRAVGRPLAVAIAHPDRDATLPAPGAARWLVAAALVASALIAAGRVLGRRAWLAAWPVASAALVLVAHGVPTLSSRPPGAVLLAAGAVPAAAAWWLGARGASGVRTLGAALAPAVMVVVGLAVVAGVPAALLGGPPARLPWWTGALGAATGVLAGAAGAVGGLLVASGVRTVASAGRTAASGGRTDVSASRTSSG